MAPERKLHQALLVSYQASPAQPRVCSGCAVLDTYVKAHQHARQAEETSDLESDEELGERRKKRPSRFEDDGDFDDQADVYGGVP
ncbi:UNVERIFIED_CONTAM: hypothetical protein FKN15_070818 [Acipenser sinensis]